MDRRKTTRRSFWRIIVPYFLALFFSGLGLVALSLCIPFVKKNGIHFAEALYTGGYDINPPAGYSIHGINVSWYQLLVDWKTVKEQNKVQFAFIKATEGESMVDRIFSRNWKQTRKYGIKRGAYHFFRPKVSGKVQALNYLNVVDFQKGDLAPVLDIEVFNGSPKGFYEEIDIWLKIVEEKTGKRPIIYSGRAFYAEHLAKGYNQYPFLGGQL